MTGAAFALSQCQPSDSYVPIIITEPESGAYQVFVYGGSEPCERKLLLAEIEGQGSGQSVELSVDSRGFEVVSIQMIAAGQLQDIELRLGK